MNKKIIGLLLILLVIFNEAGCSEKSKQNLKSEKKQNIEVIFKSSDNDFWQTVKSGAVDAGKEFGVNINVNSPLNENNIEDQIKLVENAIENKVDAIVLAASDYKRLVDVSEKAIDKGIPVIIIDSAIDSSRVTSTIATDNKEAAIKAGNVLIDIVDKKANVGMVSFVKGAATSDEREAGVFESFSNYPDMKVVDKIYTNSDENKATELTKEMMKRHPEINAIIALNGLSATGAARAIQELNLAGKVKMVTFDNTIGEIDYLEDGVIQATVIQNPYNMGYLGIKYAYDAINNISIPKTMNTGYHVIDKKNMYLPENQKLLFPFVK